MRVVKAVVGPWVLKLCCILAPKFEICGSSELGIGNESSETLFEAVKIPRGPAGLSRLFPFARVPFGRLF